MSKFEFLPVYWGDPKNDKNILVGGIHFEDREVFVNYVNSMEINTIEEFVRVTRDFIDEHKRGFIGAF